MTPGSIPRVMKNFLQILDGVVGYPHKQLGVETVKHGIVEFLKPDLVELFKTQKQSKIFRPLTILQKQSNLIYY